MQKLLKSLIKKPCTLIYKKRCSWLKMSLLIFIDEALHMTF